MSIFPCFSAAGAAEPEPDPSMQPLAAGPVPKPMSPVEELHAVEKEEQANQLREGSYYFLISSRWHIEWRQWVGHRSTRSPKTGPWPAPVELSAQELLDAPDEPGPQLALTPERQRSWTKERPGPIDNSGLLDSGRSGKLSANLCEHSDYEILSEGVWTLLHSWYDGGPPIKRRAISQPSGHVVLELYGLTLKVFTSSNLSAEPTTIMESKSSTVEAFKKRACEELGLQVENCRVWDYFNRRKYKNLEEEGRLQKTLDDNQIYEDNDILVEVKLADGSWPKEEETPIGRPSHLVEDVPTSGAPPMRGAVGLTNLGNTCFMNSSLQCLSNIPDVRTFFIDKKYEEDLNDGAYKTKGKLAQATAQLLTHMWDASTVSVAPRAFKWQIGQFAEQFAGFGQQDSMEFIEYLLDGLKEDVNRVKGQKPFVETKEAEGRPDDVVADEAKHNYSLRNSSYIDELFLGFFKSTVTCPQPGCGRVSVTFDPYLSVKLSLVSASEERSVSFEVLVVPIAGTPRPTWHKVSVAKFGDAQELVRAAAAAGGVDANNCVLAEIITHENPEKIYKFFEPSDAVDKIGHTDVLVLYELENAEEFRLTYEERWGRQDESQADQEKDGKCSVVIYQRQTRMPSNSSYTQSSFLAMPLVTCVKKRTTGKELFEEVRRELRKHMPNAADSNEWQLFRTGDKWNVVHTKTEVENNDEELTFDHRQYLVVEWKEGEEVAEAQAMRKLLEEAPSASSNNNGRRGGAGGGSVSVEDCFRMFTETDKLPPSDAWYCNKCKEHREAFKKMEFWSFPPVLVLQLKRFTYSQYSRERLNTNVAFPMDGLDVTSYASRPPSSPQVYDLAAVSIHMGGLGGGHYVAYARSSENGKWYDFNDSRVGEVPASQVLNEQCGAYVLFYIRRDHRPAGWGPPTETTSSPVGADSPSAMQQ